MLSDFTAVPGACHLVLSPRIELGIHPYQGCGMPFTYESLERVARIELANSPWQGDRLPLHHTRKSVLILRCSQVFESVSSI